MKKIAQSNDYAYRLDQIAWISLKKYDSNNLKIKDPRLEIILIGNSSIHIIHFGTYEAAEEEYKKLVRAMEEL